MPADSTPELHVAALETLRQHYDTATPAFEVLGQGGAAIRRAIWAPGVETRAQGFAYLDQRIASDVRARVSSVAEPRLLDLGCGVGTSLIRMACDDGFRGVGVTISGLQAERAERYAQAAGVGDRVTFLHQSFTDLPDSLGAFDAAFTIEAFVHAPGPEVFFAQASRRIRQGGLLIVCDDMLTARAPSSARERRWIEEFRAGWLASSLVTDAQAIACAGQAGFRCVLNDDLTPYLELRRPRDLVISALVAVGRHLPIKHPVWLSWYGGNGLQLSLVHGTIAYRYLVFQRL
jgi:cyclopropane fatty-acyl-phospholipid synthase-like methyltransferase